MQSLSKYPWHFNRDGVNSPKIHMEPQKTSNYQNGLENKE